MFCRILFAVESTLEINISSGSHGPYAVSTGATLRITGSHTFADAANEIISWAGTVEFSAGMVNVNSSYGPLGSTTVSGATATFTKLATSSGPFSVSAGTLSFSGNHDFTGADTITGTGTGAVEFVSGTIAVSNSYGISGPTTISGATVSLSNLAAITGAFNVSSGLLRFSGDHTFDPSSSISGAGLVEFATGDTYVINGDYTLTGDTAVKGIVQINYPAPASDSTGRMNVSGTLVISGSHNFNSGADFSDAGTVEFKSGAIGFAGIYNLTGTTTVSGATVVLSGATLTNLGATLNLTGGSLYFGNLDTSVTAFNWSGGDMGGSGGATIVPAGGQLNFSGADALTLSTRNLINDGTATWDRQAGDSYLFLAIGANFTNSATATFNLQNSGSFVFNGTGSFTNEGVFNKNNSNAAVIAGIAFFNNASGGSLGVNVNDGSLEIGSFSTIDSTSSGSYKVSIGATLIFSGSAIHTFKPSAAISGAGNVEFKSGTQDFNGTYAVSGITTVSGAAASFLSTATLSDLGDTLSISGGKLLLNSGDAPSIESLGLSGGELSGSDVITVTTQMNWSDGIMTGSGKTLVDGILDFAGNKPLALAQRELVVNDTANWNSSAYLYLTEPAIFRIASGAAFLANPTSTYLFYGTGECINAGTMTLHGGIMQLRVFTQESTGITKMIFKGLTPGTDFSQIKTVFANLAGELEVSGTANFQTSTATRFELLTYINQPVNHFTKVTRKTPFDSWGTKYLADWFYITIPSLHIFIPLLTK